MITGATGLLGANAALDLSTDCDVIGLARSVPSAAPIKMLPVDLSSQHERDGLVKKVMPDVVLHCAANAVHEACEADPESAYEINTKATKDLAEQAASVGARFVYISTDAVFDGARGRYRETDTPSPTSVYGQSKLAGEHAVLTSSPNALVARVNFYGWSPTGRRSLAEYFFNTLAAGLAAPGFTDARVSTLYVGDLIARIRSLLDAGASGVYHVVNDESITKYEFGRLIAAAWNFDADRVTAALSADTLSVARGADLSLDTEKMRAFISTPTTQQDGVLRLFNAWREGRRDTLKSFQNTDSRSFRKNNVS